MVILAKIKDFVKAFREKVKAHKADIALFLIIILLILFSFACGYIMGKYSNKPQIQFYANT